MKPELTQARLKELLHYDLDTGIFTWRVRRTRAAAVGAVAGSRTRDGYRAIQVDGKLYLAHRLAFLWVTGAFPAKEVDHIDRDRSNNQWRNLRPASRGQNNSNTSLRSDNLTSHRGVYQRGPKRWAAQGRKDGKAHHLGVFESPEEAAVVASRWRKEHFKEFAPQD